MHPSNPLGDREGVVTAMAAVGVGMEHLAAIVALTSRSSPSTAPLLESCLKLGEVDTGVWDTAFPETGP